MFEGKIILVAIACAILSYVIAKSRGFKNPVLWGVGGLVGSFLTVFLISFLKKKSEEKKQK